MQVAEARPLAGAGGSLKGRSTRVRSAGVHSSTVTNSGLATLKALPELWLIYASNTPITSGGPRSHRPPSGCKLFPVTCPLVSVSGACSLYLLPRTDELGACL